MTKDIFANPDALPAENVLTIADRLEFRAGIESFAQMRDQYFDAMDLPHDARILELGGGTGISRHQPEAVLCALRAKSDPLAFTDIMSEAGGRAVVRQVARWQGTQQHAIAARWAMTCAGSS